MEEIKSNNNFWYQKADYYYAELNEESEKATRLCNEVLNVYIDI